MSGCKQSRGNPQNLDFWAWAHGVVDRAPVCHFGRPRVQTLTRPYFFTDLQSFVETHTLLHSVHWCQNWAGRLLLG
jgi:hypothetical protein